VAALTLLGLLSYRTIILLMVTEQQRQQHLLEQLAWGTSRRVGPDFLAGLVSTIVDTMSVDLAFVSESNAEGLTDRIVSCSVASGMNLPATLRSGQTIQCEESHLSSVIPEHAIYLIDLTDADEHIAGHLCLFHVRTDEISPGQQSSLQIFASRASAELLRLRADKKSEAMEARMLQVQKLESLGVLAGGIAHDFNNLLQAIQGYTTLAADTLSSGSESHKAISRIDPVIDKGAAMCDRLLAYAGRSVRRDSVCQLNHLVTEAVDIVRSARPECSVTVQQTDEPLQVWGDSAQLSQVLINILTNAVDSLVSTNDRIEVVTQIGDGGNPIAQKLNLKDASEFAFVQVNDNGCGIPEEAQPKLFDPFFTSKGEGRGIGLAAVSGIVKAHQGDIAFTSEVGIGTKFVVAIPITQIQPEISSDPAITLNPVTDLTILVVDDDEMVLATTQRLLESVSIDVVTASSGQDAVEVIEQREDSVDVVLIDQTMPGMSGLEACNELRNQGVKAPFILMSGYCEIDAVTELQEVSYLNKPYTRQDLLHAVSEAVTHSKKLQADART